MYVCKSNQRQTKRYKRDIAVHLLYLFGSILTIKNLEISFFMHTKSVIPFCK